MPPRKKKQPNASSAKEAGAEGEAPDLRELASKFGKPGAVLLVIALGVVWVMHMEKVALHQRLHRSLAEDERTASWFADQLRLVDAASGTSSSKAQDARGVPAPPQALWCGRVSRLVLAQPHDSRADAAELLAIELDDATLLAGKAGKRDGSAVYISVRGVHFPDGSPTEGESWVVSVTRTSEGNNLLLSAARYFQSR